MNKKVRGIIRPVLVLVIVGVIVGLGIVYSEVDSMGNVSADSEVISPETPPVDNDTSTGDDVQNEDSDENSGEIVEDAIPTFPRYQVNGVVSLGDATTDVGAVRALGKGYIVAGTTSGTTGDLVTSGNRSLFLAYIEGDSIVNAEVISEDRDVTLLGISIGSHGIAIATKSDSGVYLYRYDFARTLISRRVIDGVSDARLVDAEYIALIYMREGRWTLDSYDMRAEINSILDIDIHAGLKAVYSETNDVIRLVFDSGDVVALSRDRVLSLKKIVKVEDIEPIMRDGKAMYGVVSGDELLTYDRDFCMVGRTKASGDEILYAGGLYVIDRTKKSADIYCKCGEYSLTTECNIDRVEYIDHIKGRLVYIGHDGNRYITHFGDLMGGEISAKRVYYMGDTFDIVAGDRLDIMYH